jgi:gamma-glutamyltranspeptidase
MSPVIFIDNDAKIRLVGGASGGPRIPTATSQTILNYFGRGMDILSAVAHPRVHSQLFPLTVYVEHDHRLLSGLTLCNPESVDQSLAKRGHNITRWSKSMAVSQFIAIDPDTGLLTAVSDPRKSGRPRGLV